ncbi:MAG TPA: FAD-binding oxidoreductase [Bryobacterales bacterium]|nr:FAD-binding oxidoreductase [Bryobacterales bacterium]
MGDSVFPAGHRPDFHAVVVGAGVIGICCAYVLARRGARVTVLERGEIGRGASYGNSGAVAIGHTPINKPGRVQQALRSLLDPLSPLYVPPRLDPRLAMWLWRFSRKCTQGHLEYCMQVLGALGHATRELFAEWIEREKLECCYRSEGYYELYRTGRGLESAKSEARLIGRSGFRTETLSGDELREREPAINAEVLGGVFHPEAATLHPYRFVLELAERARRYGAAFRTGAEVASVLTEGGKARGVRTREGETVAAQAVVLATGAYGGPLTRALGLHLPLQAAKGYHRDCEPGDGRAPLLRHACVLGEHSVFCSPMDGFVRFAGTMEFSGINHEIRRRRLEQLTNAAKRFFHGLEDIKFRSEWCGLRPCLPDGLPAVGPASGYEGLFIATGHAMLGLTLGPVTARIIAGCILDGAPGMDIAALRPERF